MWLDVSAREKHGYMTQTNGSFIPGVMVAILILLMFTSTALGEKHCILFANTCVTHCPRGMHPYHTRCDEDTVSQRTCEEPFVYKIECRNIKTAVYYTCVDHFPCTLTKTRPRTRRRKHPRIQLHDDDFPAQIYTGHCPMLKFRFGKCYGDNTRQILREIRHKGLFNKPLEYRPGDNYEVNNFPKRDMPQHDVYDGLKNRQTSYMTGYTGYVPGMHFRYGKSYGKAADDCMADFAENQREIRRKADLNKSYVRSRSAPKMETVHSRDEIRRDLSRFREINKYKENTISPEFPPIAGYTGHIPRIKGSEASLSQRYHCAAKRGLELIRMEREKRKELQNADSNVRTILKDHEKKYSYWNWG